ncbi:MAG: transglycosylase SLT domain-containing protein [Pseudomonadales bacterium]|nr:transglycosylase SLT domain-containing protein [Pseudomonadales bacterium]
MSSSRRQFLVSSAILLSAGSLSSVSNIASAQPLRFLLEKQHSPKLDANQRFRLTRATLDVLDTHYSGMTLQFWAKPYEQIDFEKRITNIVYWIDQAIQTHQGLHAVDPVWVISQIMAESLFCEFAISNSLAAGICQFMPNTAAKSYDMLIAGGSPKHFRAPYVKTDLADSFGEYQRLIKERTQYKKGSRQYQSFNLNKALEWLAEGKFGMEQALQQIERNKKIAQYNEKIKQARQNYVTFIEANIDALGKRDIFNETEFFVNFDERFTYKKPILAMVHMLANALRVRGGNILSAAAAYNAGLSRTWTNEALYTQYGKLPNFAETSTYLSRIVANYEEIANRYYV